MLSIDVGKVSRHPAPAGPVGDESFPPAAQQPPGLIPGTIAACPTACMPRPRNLPEYRAACRVAQGEAVREYDACHIVPGMHAYQSGRFLEVIATDRHDPHGDVELRMAGGGLHVVRVLAATTAVYVLAPAPDAIHAPGAGAAADESTAAAR